jgi:hypothetical protein
MRDATGQLHSLQRIRPDGTKRFLPGGRVDGCFFLIGEEGPRMAVAEGFATAASVHEATGMPVAVAFNAGNLPKVAKALRDKHPAAQLVICADDDHLTAGNPGMTKAREAANACGGVVVKPDFGPDREQAQKDFNDMVAAFGNYVVAKHILDAANGSASESMGPAFSLTRFKDILLGTTRNYLVKGWIPRRGLVVVWGPPKCGKSFWVFDVVMHVALGREYRGHKVVPGPVVYFAFEGADGFKARKEAFHRERMDQVELDPPFFLVSARADLATAVAQMIADIKAQIGDTLPAVVVLDTLNRSLAGSENDPKDMALYLAAVSAIEHAFGCTIVVIHHCGINGERPRGHTSLTGAADVEIEVKREGRGPFTATVRFAKDGPEGATMACQLEVVVVGIDDDGDDITSCIVAAVEAMPAADNKKSRKLTVPEQLAKRTLADVLCSSGIPCPEAPAGLKAVNVEKWRSKFYEVACHDDGPETRKKAFQRARNGLLAKNEIGAQNGFAWLPTITQAP